MRSPMRIAAPLAVIASLAAVSPAVAASGPTAHAAGGDAPAALNYPSIVQTRFDRTERALRRATKAIENGDPVKTTANLKVVRRQMSSAWRGAKYIIRTTPPPPPPADDQAEFPPPNPSTGPAVASPADTGYLVLYLQHEVASSMYQLIDGAHGTGLNDISRTMNFALDRRDAALNDILALAPPAPPPPTDDRVQARASGGAPVVSTFDIVMPNYVPLLADEVQAIEGTKSDATDLTSGGRRLLGLAETQVLKTQGFVNTTWPPLPPGDD
jgi:hypothetical protein